MRKIVRMAVVGVMVIAASAMAAERKKVAKDSTATTRPSQQQTVKTVRGEIASVDIESKTLKIDIKEKQEMTQRVVATDEKTEFSLDGELVSIVDLRAGMRVSFQPAAGVATRVSARSMNSREQKDFDEKKAAKAG